MRKLITLALFGLFTLSLWAQTTYPTTSYELSPDGKTLVKWSGFETEIDMTQDPALQGVTIVGNNAFREKPRLAKVIFPPNLIKIGYGAFNTCPLLAEVVFPTTIKSIEGSVFENCRALTKADLPEGLQLIENNAFSQTNLQEVVIPASVKRINSYAFGGSSIKKLVIKPGALKKIENGAFSHTKQLEELDLGTTIEELFVGAFSNSGPIKEVIIPASVKTLGNEVFSGSSLKKLVILDGALNTIPNYAFRNTKQLEELDLGTTIVELKKNSFENSGPIKEVKIPASLYELGAQAFKGSDLKKLTILDGNLTIIDGEAFQNTKNLEEVDLGKKIKIIAKGCFMSSGPIAQITLPASLETLEEKAFYKSKLKKLKIENGSMTVIEPRAFAATTDLAELDLGTVLTEIKEEAFMGSGPIASVTLPASLTKLGTKAFEASGLKKLVIKNSPMTVIEPRTFAHTSLLADVDLGTVLTEIKEEAFVSSGPIASVTLPASLTKLGTKAFEKSKLKKLLIKDGPMTVIEERTFAETSLLAEVNLGTKLTEIKVEAFKKSGPIASITLPATLAKLGEEAFSGSGVKKLKILDSPLTVIEQKTFFETKFLEEVDLGKKLINIKRNAFRASGSIKEITLPASFVNMGDSAFYASGVKKLSVENGSKAIINQGAFAETKDLAAVSLGTTEEIHKAAFKNSGPIEELTLPITLRKLGEEAFYNSQLKKLTVENGLKEIEVQAFAETKFLKEVNLLGATLEKIAKRSFYNSLLEKLDIVDNPKLVIDEEAFLNSTKLSHLTLGNTKEIHKAAFKNSGPIADLTLPASLRKLGEEAFFKSGVKKLTVENGLEVIEKQAFAETAGLEEATIQGSTLKTIQERGFYKTGLKKLDILSAPNLVIEKEGFLDNKQLAHLTLGDTKEIHHSAFKNSGPIADLTLPASLRKLGEESFYNSGVKKLTVEGGLKLIEKQAFAQTTGLAEANLKGATLETIEERAFYKSGLQKLAIEAGSNLVIEKEAFLDNKNLALLSLGNTTKIGESAFENSGPIADLSIPGSMLTIDKKAFHNSRVLKLTVAPTSAVSIGEEAFAKTSSLVAVTLGGTKEIHKAAFRESGAIADLTLPASLTKLGEQAFYKSRVKKLTVESGLKQIEKEAFSETKNLGEVKMLGNQLEMIGNSAFYNSNLNKLEIEAGAANLVIDEKAFENTTRLTDVALGNTKEIRKSAFRKTGVIPNLILPASLRKLGEDAFRESGVKNLEIKDGLEVIEDRAFLECLGLQTIKLPATLKKIGEEAFSKAPLLLKFDFPEGLREIGKKAFFYAPLVEEYILPESVTKIGAYAFAHTELDEQPEVISGLLKVKLPDGLQVLPEGVFSGSTALSKINIPSKLRRVEKRAFIGCASLEEMHLPEGLPEIGMKAFEGCANIRELTLPSTLRKIGENGFLNCSRLVEIHSNAVNPPQLGLVVFVSEGLKPSETTVYVPAGSVPAYKNAPQWRRFNYHYLRIDETNSDYWKENMFYFCKNDPEPIDFNKYIADTPLEAGGILEASLKTGKFFSNILVDEKLTVVPQEATVYYVRANGGGIERVKSSEIELVLIPRDVIALQDRMDIIGGVLKKTIGEQDTIFVTLGEPFSIKLFAESAPAVSNEWTKDGAVLASVTGSEYAVTTAATSHTGLYEFTVKDFCGVSASKSFVVATVSKPTLELDIDKNLMICRNELVDLNDYVKQAVGQNYVVEFFKDPSCKIKVEDPAAVIILKDVIFYAKLKNEAGTYSDVINFKISLIEHVAVDAGTTSNEQTILKRGENLELKIGLVDASIVKSYSWDKMGGSPRDLSAFTGNTLELDKMDLEDGGTYTVQITNSCDVLYTHRFNVRVNDVLQLKRNKKILLPVCKGTSLELTEYADLVGAESNILIEAYNENLEKLTSTNVVVNESGKYYLQARINGSDIVGNLVDLQVQILTPADVLFRDAPTVSGGVLSSSPTESNVIYVGLGETLRVEPKILSGVAHAYVWKKDGTLLPTTDKFLQIAGVAATDAGVYELQAMNVCNLLAGSFSFEVRVQSKPTLSIDASQETTHCRGSQINLNEYIVQPAGQDLAVEFFRDAAETRRIADSFNFILSKDETLYARAKNQANIYSDQINFTLKTVVFLDINVGDTSPAQTKLDRGDKLELSVAVVDISKVKSYSWNKLGGSPRDLSGFTTNKLELDNMDLEDAGTYMVEIASNCGDITTHRFIVRLDDVLLLKRNKKPFVPVCSGTEVELADFVTLASTEPDIELEAYNENFELQPSTKVAVTEKTKYYLQARRGNSTVVGNSVEVQTEILSPADVFFRDVLGISGGVLSSEISEMRVVYARAGEALRVEPQILSGVADAYTWKKDGTTLGTTDKFLQITAVTATDAGVYVLETKNICGLVSGSTSFEVKVLDKPGLILDGNQELILCYGTQLNLNEYVLQPLPQDFEVEFFRDAAGKRRITDPSGFVVSKDETIYAKVKNQANAYSDAVVIDLQVVAMIEVDASTTSPAQTTLNRGDRLMLTVGATDVSSARSYTWSLRGSYEDFSNFTGATLEIEHVDMPHSGTYDVLIENSCGEITQHSFKVKVEDILQLKKKKSFVPVCSGTELELADFVELSTTESNVVLVAYNENLELLTSTKVTVNEKEKYFLRAKVQGSDVEGNSIEIQTDILTPADVLFRDVPAVSGGVLSSPTESRVIYVGLGETLRVEPKIFSGVAHAYVWKKDGTLLPTTDKFLQIADVAATDAGVYELQAMNVCNLLAGSFSFEVRVQSKPTLSIDASQETTHCRGSQINLNEYIVQLVGQDLDVEFFRDAAETRRIADSFNFILSKDETLYARAKNQANIYSDQINFTLKTVILLDINVGDTSPAQTKLDRGDKLELSVAVVDISKVKSYSWNKLGGSPRDLSGFTTNKLELDNMDLEDAGTYMVEIASNCGDITTHRFIVRLDDVLHLKRNKKPFVPVCSGTEVELADFVTLASTEPDIELEAYNENFELQPSTKVAVTEKTKYYLQARRGNSTIVGNSVEVQTEILSPADVFFRDALGISGGVLSSEISEMRVVYARAGEALRVEPQILSGVADAYTWKKDGTALGATDKFLQITAVTATDAGVYLLETKNICGLVSGSTSFEVKVLDKPGLILDGDQELTLCRGTQLNLNEYVLQPLPQDFEVEFFRDAAGKRRIIDPSGFVVNKDETIYAKVKNQANAYSDAVVIDLQVLAMIEVDEGTTSPAQITLNRGDKLRLTVGVTDAPSVESYTWSLRENYEDFSFFTDATLEIDHADMKHAGIYDVLIENSCGETTQHSFKVKVEDILQLKKKKSFASVCSGTELELADFVELSTTKPTVVIKAYDETFTPLSSTVVEVTKKAKYYLQAHASDSGIAGNLVEIEVDVLTFAEVLFRDRLSISNGVLGNESLGLRVVYLTIGDELRVEPLIFSGESSVSSYAWSKDGTVLSSTDKLLQIAAVTAVDAGVYKLEAKNSCGFVSGSSSFEVKVLDKPSLTLDGTQELTLCRGTQLNLNEYVLQPSSQDFEVEFFRDAAGKRRITDPSSFVLSKDETIYAKVKNEANTYSNQIKIALSVFTPLELNVSTTSAPQIELNRGDELKLRIGFLDESKAHSFTWDKKGGSMRNLSWFGTNELILSDLDLDDAGTYTVEVESHCGDKINRSFVVKVVDILLLKRSQKSLEPICKGEEIELQNYVEFVHSSSSSSSSIAFKAYDISRVELPSTKVTVNANTKFLLEAYIIGTNIVSDAFVLEVEVGGPVFFPVIDSQKSALIVGDSTELKAIYSGGVNTQVDWYGADGELVAASPTLWVTNNSKDPKGLRTFKAVITDACDGSKVERSIDVDFYLDPTLIIKQKNKYMLFVSNNKENNGGYKFTSYTWFMGNRAEDKKGFAPGLYTLQTYTPDENKKVPLSTSAYYQVELVTEDGVTLRTSPFQVKTDKPYTYDLKLYPNPINVGGLVTLENNLDPASYDSAVIEVYNAAGVLELRLQVDDSKTTFSLTTSGVYYIRFKASDFVDSKALIVN